MKKSVIATAVAVSMGLGISGAYAADMSSATFIMLTVSGAQGNPDGDDTTVTGTIGGGVWGIASTKPFSGSTWTADGGTTFGPGTYSFDTLNNNTPGPWYTSVIVGAGQVGGHILFNWGAATTATPCGKDNCGIDVVNVWDVSTVGGVTTYTSTDVAANKLVAKGTKTVLGPDGVRGLGMIDGPFKDFNANFDFTTSTLPPGTPIAGDFTIFTLVDQPVNNVDMLAHATDPDNDPLSLDNCAAASLLGGVVTQNLPASTCSYTPPAGADNTLDTFTYQVKDAALTSAPGTVTVDIGTTPPECDPDVMLTALKDTATVIPEASLLVNCTDPDGDETLSVTGITAQPANGTLDASNLPDLTYTPNAGYIGPDSFQYTVSDPRGGETTATAELDVSDTVFGNFTMIDAAATTFGGTNDIVATWDGTLNTAVTDINFNMTMGSQSSFPFFGFPWFAHDIRVFGPGTYNFDTSCSTAEVQQGLADCGGDANEFLTLTVGPDQIGAHMLFDWNVTANIDVVNLWDNNGVFTNPDPAGSLYQGPAGPTPAINCVFELVSRDGDGDTVPGVKFIDGPFINFRANFNLNFNQNCGAGTVEVTKSRIKDSDPGGGCTLSGATTTPLSRGDFWLTLGFIASLGAFVTRRRILKRARLH